jgi:uncharacterized membrane protein
LFGWRGAITWGAAGRQLKKEQDMAEEERWQGIAIYAIYLVALFTALPFLLGVVLAYVFKGSATIEARTHFEHQIGLFWRFFLGNVVNAGLFFVGLALSSTVVLAVLGLPIMILSGIVFVWLWLMMLARCLRGIGRLNANQAFPVPAGWGL